MTEDRRHPHRPFDPEIIQEYLRGRKVEAVHLFASGKSHSNYKLNIDGETCVLRLYPSKTAPRERKVMQLVDGRVPIPDCLASGEDWLLSSFVEGEHLSDHPEAIRAAARMATRIWDVRFPKAGWINSDGDVVPFDFETEGEKDFGSAMLKNPDVKKWLRPQAIQTLADIFDLESKRPG